MLKICDSLNILDIQFKLVILNKFRILDLNNNASVLYVSISIDLYISSSITSSSFSKSISLYDLKIFSFISPISSNIFKFLRQELMIGSLLAIILSTVAFIRVYTVHYDLVGSLIVSISLGSIVFISVLLGASFPIGLKKLGLDPAFSAGPFLATIMDILGIFIYCYIAYLALA